MPDTFQVGTHSQVPPKRAPDARPVQGPPARSEFNAHRTTWYSAVRPTPRPAGSAEPINPDPNLEGVTWFTLEDGSMIPGEGTYYDIVAENMWAVIECANNIDAIIASGDNAAAAAGSAADAANSASEAADYWKTFNSMWYGPFPSAPMLDPFGGAPTQGDVYFDTTTNTVMVYNNFNTWVPITGLVPSGAIIQGTPPPSSAPGTLWWDSVGGQLYVRYDDGNGPAQWVAASNVLSGGGATGNYLPIAGGTLTGPLTLAADPTLPLHATTKQYTDTKIGDAPNDGQYYSRRSLAWAVTPAGLTDAPNDTNAYGRRGAAWATVLPTAGGTQTGLTTFTGGISTGSQLATGGPPTIDVSKHIALYSTTYGINVIPAHVQIIAGSALCAQFNANGMQAAVGVTAPSTGAFTNLSASGTVTGVGFNNLLAIYARLASPVFTGDPQAPTPTAGDNDTSIATTAFVTNAVTSVSVPPATNTPLMDGAAAIGVVNRYAREDHIHPTDATLAPLASPTLTGTPRAPTATTGTSTTQIATTAFVGASMSAAGAITEAPSDSQYYSRRNAAWAVSPGGLIDAPNDANTYGRAAAAWATVVPIAGGTMTGNLTLPVGTVSAPSLNFTGATTTGFSYVGSNIGFVLGATTRLQVSATRVTSQIVYWSPNGSVGLPTYTFSAENTSGLWLKSVGNLSVSATGAEVMSWGASKTTTAYGPVMLAADATAPLQAVTFQQLNSAIAAVPAGASPSNANPATNGIAAPGVSALYARGDHVHGGDPAVPFTPSGNIASTTVQTAIAELDSEKIAKAGDTMTGNLTIPLGAAATPTLVFATLPTTGLYSTGGGIGFAIAGSNRLTLNSANLTASVVHRSNDGTVGTPCYGFWSEVTSGLYRKAAGSLSMSATGVEVMNWNATSKLTTAYGAIALPADPVNPLEAATKQYVDGKVGVVTIAATPPAVVHGALFWDSTGGQLYIGYNDGNSIAWVAASSQIP